MGLEVLIANVGPWIAGVVLGIVAIWSVHRISRNQGREEGRRERLEEVDDAKERDIKARAAARGGALGRALERLRRQGR